MLKVQRAPNTNVPVTSNRTTFVLTIPGITILIAALSINDKNNMLIDEFLFFDVCHYAECCFTECYGARFIFLY